MPNKKELINYHDGVIYPSDLALLDSPTAWLNDACINFQMTRLQHRPSVKRGVEVETERKKQKQNEKGVNCDDGERIDKLEDLFVDPCVISFLMHQLAEDDEDYDDELSNLNLCWKLPRPPTSGHQCNLRKKMDSEQPCSQKSLRKYQWKRVFVPISDQFGASRSTFARPGGGYHWSLLLWEISAFYEKIGDGINASVDEVVYHFDSSRGVNALAAKAVATKLHKVLCASMSKKDGVAEVVKGLESMECETPQQQNGYDCGVFTLGVAEALSALSEYGFVKEQYEALLQSHFEENGGYEEFASGLRKRIGNDIRKFAAQK